MLYHLASYKVSLAPSCRYIGGVAPPPSLTEGPKGTRNLYLDVGELLLQRLAGEYGKLDKIHLHQKGNCCSTIHQFSKGSQISLLLPTICQVSKESHIPHTWFVSSRCSRVVAPTHCGSMGEPDASPLAVEELPTAPTPSREARQLSSRCKIVVAPALSRSARKDRCLLSTSRRLALID